MKPCDAAECIAHILQDIEKRRIVDYADKNSVRRYNAAFDRILKNANYLCDNFPDQMDLFMELVNHSDYVISATCTSTLFGLHSATKDQKQAAITSAKRLLSHPEANAIARFAWKTNIERWQSALNQSVEL